MGNFVHTIGIEYDIAQPNDRISQAYQGENLRILVHHYYREKSVCLIYLGYQNRWDTWLCLLIIGDEL